MHTKAANTLSAVIFSFVTSVNSTNPDKSATVITILCAAATGMKVTVVYSNTGTAELTITNQKTGRKLSLETFGIVFVNRKKRLMIIYKMRRKFVL